MNKNIDRCISSYTLRESGIDNNRYVFFEDRTNRWFILPELSYNEAICFDFAKYHKKMQKCSKRLIKNILQDKKYRKKVEACNSYDIEQIKKLFSVNHIKYACENFHPEYCNNVLNKTCIVCEYRNNDFESLENEGGVYENK